MTRMAHQGLIQRTSFSKISLTIEIPDLVEVQRRSYDDFLQAGTSPDRREEKGLHAALKSVFPISDYNNSALLEFSSYSLGTPKYDVRECLEQGMTFAAPLKLRVRLVRFDNQDKNVKKPSPGCARARSVCRRIAFNDGSRHLYCEWHGASGCESASPIAGGFLWPR